jgi:hypothetical protein
VQRPFEDLKILTTPKVSDYCREIDHIKYEDFNSSGSKNIKLYTVDYNYTNGNPKYTNGKAGQWARKVAALQQRDGLIIDYFLRDLSSKEVISNNKDLKRMFKGNSEFNQNFDFG